MNVRRIAHITESGWGKDTEGGGQENGEGGLKRGGHALGSSHQAAIEIGNGLEPGVSRSAGIELDPATAGDCRKTGRRAQAEIRLSKSRN